jgi:hypothetical protein
MEIMGILNLVACGDVLLGKFFLLGLHDPDDGVATVLHNVRIYSPSHTASHLRRPYSYIVPLL